MYLAVLLSERFAAGSGQGRGAVVGGRPRPAQFDQAFSDGSELTQRQAVDIARDPRATGPQRS